MSSSSDDSTPVKSIFEGASKYDILNYLEDARERGLTDCDLGDLEEEQEEEQDHGEPPEVRGAVGFTHIFSAHKIMLFTYDLLHYWSLLTVLIIACSINITIYHTEESE